MASAVDLSEYKSMFASDPDGFQELIEHEITDAVSTYDCPNGERVVQVERRKLHSGRDPRAEAKRFVRNFPLDGKRFVLLMGFGSGYVAQALLAKESLVVLVYEPSLSILKEGLPHLAPNPDIRVFTSQLALERYFESNRILFKELKMLQWPASSRIQGEIFEQTAKLVLAKLNQSQLTQNTHDTRSRDWLKNYLRNLPQFAKHPNLNNYRNAFKGYPAIICSAGPSLSDNVHLLKQLNGKCLVIAVNTAAKALAAAGVEADIVVCVESLNITSHFQGIEWLPRCTAFLETTGAPEAFDLPFGAIVPISVHSDHASGFSHQLAPGQTFSAGFCVAHAALALASQLGCSGIVLIGQNLAFKDGRAYAKGTTFEDIRVVSQRGKAKFQNVESKEQILQASQGSARDNHDLEKSIPMTRMPAWGGSNDFVETSTVYSVFADWFSEASRGLTEQNIWHINATQGGVHIEHWEDLPLAETIERYDLDKAPAKPQEHVRVRLRELSQQPALSGQHVIQELEKEQAKLDVILTSVTDLQAWVNDDPDGDLKASAEASERIFDTWEELREQIRDTHLLQAQIARSLSDILARQELNTFALATVIATEIRQLSDAIELVLNTLRNDAPQTRAAS